MVELIIVINVVLLLLIAFIEFGVAMNQWNLAAKSVQVGARLASVSDPVDQDLSAYTGLETGSSPGDPIDQASNDFTTTCQAGTCPSGTYDAAAMNRLVFGSDNACDATPPTIGMCDVFNPVAAGNVVVTYGFTGLGYAGRPSSTGKAGGPVPTITVSLTGLTFNFLLLGGLLGLNTLPIPAFPVTMVGEDLSKSYNP